jgi:hypothetical protein
MMTGDGTCGQLYKAGDSESLHLALQKSVSIDIEKEREKVFIQYERALSAEAIAKKMIKVLRNL